MYIYIYICTYTYVYQGIACVHCREAGWPGRSQASLITSEAIIYIYIYIAENSGAESGAESPGRAALAPLQTRPRSQTTDHRAAERAAETAE